MLKISKEECDYIRKHIPDPLITVCSKRKHGSKGYKTSGKTYYCPESSKYVGLLEKFNNKPNIS